MLTDKKIWEQNADCWDERMGDESNWFHRTVIRPTTPASSDPQIVTDRPAPTRVRRSPISPYPKTITADRCQKSSRCSSRRDSLSTGSTKNMATILKFPSL